MKAVVYTKYGPPNVVALAEVPKPAPKVHEVLIRIHATTVTTGDWRARSLEMPPGFGLLARLVFGVFGPRKSILGTELAGEIEAVGKAVTRFKPGDQVFAFTGASYGCHAEYRTISEAGMIALKPANLSFEEAAALSFGGTTALSFLQGKGGIKRGDKVLIVGASGGVGTAAVQIAKHFGAKVTGVCSTANLELVRSIGADKVIDYTKEDFGEEWRDLRHHPRYDRHHLVLPLRKRIEGGWSFAPCHGIVYPDPGDGAAIQGERQEGNRRRRDRALGRSALSCKSGRGGRVQAGYRSQLSAGERGRGARLCG